MSIPKVLCATIACLALGLTFDLTGALYSHVSVGDPPAGWMPAAMLFASPVRKTSDASGMLIVASPEEQLSDPLAGPETRLSTHVLVGVLLEFGTESGAPKKQPTSEQVSALPVVAAFVDPSTAVWPVQESR